MSEVGRVLGTDPAHPLDFWVGVTDDSYLQLDDIVAVKTQVPGRGEITLYGVVDTVRAKYEGARFDSDVFRVAQGVLPVGIATAAHVSVTRIEPEIFVPPQPGQPAERAEGAQRDEALYFDQMQHKFAAGLSRLGQPGVPGWDAWRTREHLGHLRRRDEDELRDVPPVLALPLGRTGDAGAQRARGDLQRQGRGPDVRGQAERPPLNR
jgi:hypothetical protein